MSASVLYKSGFRFSLLPPVPFDGMLVLRTSSGLLEPGGAKSGRFSPARKDIGLISSIIWLCRVGGGGFFFWSTALGFSTLLSLLLRLFVSFLAGRFADAGPLEVVWDVSPIEAVSVIDRLSLEVRFGAYGTSEGWLYAGLSRMASGEIVPLVLGSPPPGMGIGGGTLGPATCPLAVGCFGTGLATGVCSLEDGFARVSVPTLNNMKCEFNLPGL